MAANPFQKQTDPDTAVLTLEIERTKVAIHQAEKNYNLYTDPDLLDFCIYEKLAQQAKLNYLYNQVKAQVLLVSPEKKWPFLSRLTALRKTAL